MPNPAPHEPTLNEYGDETHPAFGMIQASRITSNPGAVLFDSEIRHSHYVTIRIGRATRKRDLNRDWIHGESQQIVEVNLSEAQWASFVSSMNTSGVPCTLRRTEQDGGAPELPFAPRMEQSQAEVREAGDRALRKVREAFAAYSERKTVGNLRALRATIENAPANMAFAAESLTEHAENVVQKARADIEAMVTAKAEQVGLDRASVAHIASLEAAPDDSTP